MDHLRRSLVLRTTLVVPFASLLAIALGACAPAGEGAGEPAILAVPGDTPPPTLLPVRSGPHDATAIAEHLADPAAVRWVSVHDLLGAGTQGCIDGRETSPVVGTPGGDAGELVLALAALEQVTGDDVDLDHVDVLFDAYTEEFGRFYLHTDEHALETLEHRVTADPRFASVAASLDGVHAIEGLVRRPPPALRSALLDHLTDPEAVGCGHLRLAMQHPQEYGARPELTEAVLRAAFRRGWEDPDRLQLVVLHGEHQEGAVVRVVLDHEVHAHTRVPTFAPRASGTEMFVIHPQVSAFMRRENAAFLLEHRDELVDGDVDEATYVTALADLAARQLAATSRRLAATLPVHEVRFHGSTPEVVPSLPRESTLLFPVTTTLGDPPATTTAPPEPIAVGITPRPMRRAAAEVLGVVSFLAVAAGLLLDQHLTVVAGLVAFGAGVGAALLGGTVIGIVQVVVEPGRGVARLATSDGGSVDVPLDAIDRAEAASHLVPRKGGAVTVWKLTLHKRDGGVLDTQIASDEPSARRAAAVLEEALAAARAAKPPPRAAAPELVAGLRGRGPLRVVATEPGTGSYRSGPARGAVSVAWSAATPWVQTAIAIGLIGGFWQIARGLTPAEGGGALAVFAWFLAAMAAVPIVLFGMSAGVEVRVDVDDEGLTVERRRFGNPFASRRYTLDDVRAVDLSVMSQMTTLVIRAAGEEPLPDLDATDGPVQLATAIARHASRANQLPLGALTLADGLSLDLALSAEIARRKGVEPGTV